MKNTDISNFPHGVITASLTPLSENGQVDHIQLSKHCNRILTHGGDGIALLGTTGEANSFSTDERREILEQLIGSGFDPNKILVGTGTCALKESVALTRHAMQLGVHGILLMPPFFYRNVTQEGLFRHFSTFIEMVANDNMRIFLYHFPQMSGIDMSLNLIARLKSAFPNIIAGMKDSGGDIDHMLAVMDAIPELEFYAGSEKFLVEVVQHGGAGCISATTNYKVESASAVYRALIAGKDHTILEATMIACREAFEGYNFAAALKGVLAKEELKDSWDILRPPLTSLSPDEVRLILAKLRHLG